MSDSDKFAADVEGSLYAIEIGGEVLTGPWTLNHIRDVLRDGEVIRVYELVEVQNPRKRLGVQK